MALASDGRPNAPPRGELAAPPPAGRSAIHPAGTLYTDDWPTYGSVPERTGANRGESTLTVANAGQLGVAWSTELNATVLGSMIVVNGTVYVGDYNGYLMAMNATTGSLFTTATSERWLTPFLGNTSYSRCGGSSGADTKLSGILATPTLSGGRIYESGGNTSFYTLSLSGQVLERVDIANASTNPWYYDYNWASPLVYRGSAYLGTAALCEFNDGDPNSADWKYMQGQLVEVNLTNGTVTHVFNVTKDRSTADTGGSIWSTPTVDPSTNTVWVTTGNENSSSETPANGEYPRSTVALNATTLAVLGACQVGSVGVDADYGAGPTLFTDATGGRYVGAINKDGVFSAYNATDPSGGDCGNPGTGDLDLAWSDDFCSGITPGTISPAAFDGRYLYIASDGCGNSSGFVDQVYPNNGTIRWSHSMYAPAAEAHAGVTVADGLVVVAANTIVTGNVGPGELQVLNASSGALLYHHAFVAEANGWPVVAEGTIFVASGNVSELQPGWITAFRIPLTPGIDVGDATCSGTPVRNCTAAGSLVSFALVPSGGAPPYTCAWLFGDSSGADGCAVDHTYAYVGDYPVTLEVFDAAGARANVSVNVTIAIVPSSGKSAPPARGGEVLAYDPVDNETVLFGGTCEQAPCAGAVLNDTWAFNATGWTNLTSQLRPAPPPLTDAAFCYDPAVGGLLVVGGETPNGSGPIDLSPWTWEFSRGRWTNLSVTLTGAPPATAGAAAAFDNGSQAVVLFGGLQGPDLDHVFSENATWTLTGDDWSRDPAALGPSARAFAGLAADGPDDELLLFGGHAANGSLLNDSWTYRSGTWTRVVTSPSPPGGDSLALVTGGPTGPVLLWNGALAASTWEFSAGFWSSLALTPRPAPGTVAGTWISYAKGALLLDGNATWGFGAGSWGILPPVASITFQPEEAEADAAFNASAEVNGGMAPMTYQWSVNGQRLSATTATVSMSLGSRGNFPVTVRATDALGEVTAAASSITVVDGLTASMLTYPQELDAGMPVIFTAQGAGGATPMSYSWEFGDGSPVVAGVAVAHTFARSGPYPVNLTVVDGLGYRATAEETFEVAPSLGLAPFVPFGPADAGYPIGVHGGGMGGHRPYAVEVTFGDGGSAAVSIGDAGAGTFNVSHTYVSAGRYLVNITEGDAAGASANASQAVLVNASIEPPHLELPGSIVVGSLETFAAITTGGSAPYTVTWSFGDGTVAIGGTVAHAFGAEGTYRVGVMVRDAVGANASATAMVTVVGPAAAPSGDLPEIVAIGATAAVVLAVSVVWYRVRRRRRGPGTD